FWMCGSPTHSQEDRADVDPALSHPPLPPPNQRLDTKKPMARLILGQVKERPTTKRLKKQGDPLSPLLFNMVIDELLHLVDNLPGGSTFEERIKCPIMAFEDDLIILEDDEAHLPNTLTTINYLLIARGMTLNPAKCHALSITMIETLNAFRYLGHNVEATGIQRPDLKNLVTWTSIQQRAPLKPDQKLRILKDHLLPRLLYGLQTPNIERRTLKEADRVDRRFIKETFHLHTHTQNSLIHAKVRDGGFGVQDLLTTIPRILLDLDSIKDEILQPPDWWNEELERFRKIYLAKKTLFYRNRFQEYSDHLFAEMTRAKETFKEKVEKRRQKCWTDFAENDLARNPWGVVYKLASEKFKTRGILQSFQTNEDDNITRDFRSTLEFLLTNLLPDDDPDINNVEQRITQSDYRTTTAEVGSDVVITDEEVNIFVSQIQNKKAPSLDNLKGKILKRLHPKITPLITRIYNACWNLNYFPTTWKKGNLVVLLKDPKASHSNIKNYRPITLLPEHGKILEKTVRKKLEEELSPLHSPRQFGFVKGRSTSDALHLLFSTIRDCQAKYVATIFFDIKGAFDNLWWPSLKKDIKKPRSLFEVDSYDQKLPNGPRCAIHTRGSIVPILSYGSRVWSDRYHIVKNQRQYVSAQAPFNRIFAKCYASVSKETAAVLAGHLPMDSEIQTRHCISEIKHGRNVLFFEELITPQTFDSIMHCREYVNLRALDRWQHRWETSTKERISFEFFPDVFRRLEGPPITFSHHKSQVLTGHGNFGIHQLRFGKNENSLCPNCPDFDDDPVHRILECPLFGEIQERIRGITGTWPPDLTQVPYIDNDEMFSALCLDLTH
ncbi:Putative 115 kDa protein in type-1 retrotransposable element R1DM-like protein, partial [Tribolium castaneum]